MNGQLPPEDTECWRSLKWLSRKMGPRKWVLLLGEAGSASFPLKGGTEELLVERETAQQKTVFVVKTALRKSDDELTN